MKTILSGLSRLQFKKDWQLILFACVLALVTGGLIWHKDVDPKVGLAFLTGALALPGLFGRAPKKFEGEDTGIDSDGGGSDGPSSGSRMKAVVDEHAETIRSMPVAPPSKPNERNKWLIEIQARLWQARLSIPQMARGWAVVIACVMAFHLLGACSVFTKKNANTALDVVQTACVIANATLSEKKVTEVCDVTDELVGPMRTLLASTKAAESARPKTLAGASSSVSSEVVCAMTDAGVACWPLRADAGVQ